MIDWPRTLYRASWAFVAAVAVSLWALRPGLTGWLLLAFGAAILAGLSVVFRSTYQPRR